jgi:hypothetical protein
MPDFVSFSISLFLFWLFAMAGVRKFTSLPYFSGLLTAYLGDRVTASLAKILTLVIATTEAGVALLILFPVSRIGGAVGVITLLLLYAGLMAWQIGRGRSALKCGCAGPGSDTRISMELVYRNLICIALACIPLVAPGGLQASMVEWLASVAITLFMIITYLCCEQLVTNRQHLLSERAT